jgi:hypothetical protein
LGRCRGRTCLGRKIFDPQWALTQHEALCGEYLVQAKVMWFLAQKAVPEAEREPLPAFWHLSYETCVNDHFSGVKPTGDDFLAFLETFGIDSKLIKESVLNSFNETAKSTQLAKQNAEKFFHIFQTEWHVKNTHVKEFIDESSVYHLIELAIADAAKTRARLNAIKRHAETNAIKNDVFQWLDGNMSKFKSMDKAAEAVIKQQPIAFRTARDWVGLLRPTEN